MQKHLAEATVSLLGMARDLAWNTISDNCLYIISNLKEREEEFGVRGKVSKARYDKMEPQYLADIMPQMLTLYPDLYDINLFVYKASNERTIIEIGYYPKSALDEDYRKTIENNPPMLHSKVSQPFYYHLNGKKKFDINWQNNSLSFKVNSFRVKFKYRFYRTIGRDYYAILTKQP
ncbi:hypothetical protein PQ469_18130 [Mucilaginibacter sp. KACC 22773]|uniref:hypothetical protein n=1 Tax=Mucilaginibacter sp. KACC 22773 TaxID=3025671 RepID=UPI002365129E|nr:hypothetical protein [Mucilaginibacter sp. KACC 22773]WDF75808.1 hypothetical protein PQ469_18130 [Mucilaginibacter sp. KACC 22773]